MTKIGSISGRGLLAGESERFGFVDYLIGIWRVEGQVTGSGRLAGERPLDASRERLWLTLPSGEVLALTIVSAGWDGRTAEILLVGTIPESLRLVPMEA